ncbi:MAG: hypothetical protein PHW62_00455 [Candidatus Ratteibacteria bacterium]|nr:hypothetical protein [Candidatus Ratteibacteria bacterium]
MNGKDVSKNVIKVAIEIYSAQKKTKPHSFSTLVKLLNGRISRNTISICIDILTDIAIVTERWDKKKINNWYRVIEISNDGIPLVEQWTKKVLCEQRT